MLTHDFKNLENSYIWEYEDINDLYSESNNKIGIIGLFCVANKMDFEKEVGYNLKNNKWYLKIDTFNI